jgi:hypothetical protein
MRAERAARARVGSFIAQLWAALLARPRRAEVDASARRLSAERARALLLACLTPAQRAEFERTRAFAVRGGKSGQRYRIAFGTMANIEVLDERGIVRYRLCAGPLDLPVPSVMLAQKLMLENSEADFLRVAARHAAPALLEARQGVI